MFFTFFKSPFWRGLAWILSFLTIYAFFGFQITTIIALAIIAMRQTEGKTLFF